MISEIIKSCKLSGFRGTPDGQDGGYWVQKLEESFREYFNIKHAVSMNSATACLHAAMFAIFRNNELVAVTPYSFSSSASCVLMVRGDVMFTDIHEDTFCINHAKMFPKPTTIIPVH